MDQCNSMECLRCLIVSCGGPDPHQIQLSIRKFLDEYIWEQDGFMLYSMRQTPCPWKCPLPNESQMEYMWSEIHHCGSVEDEWFLVFLLSYITDLFKGKVIAQVFSNEGQFLLTEAAHLLPSWVDSSRHGSVDEIANNRVWIFNGLLHLLPMRGQYDEDFSPKALTMSRAVHAVRCSTVATLAPARIQEYLFKCRLSRFPTAVQNIRHRVKIHVPKSAASVLMRSKEICACAARSFLERTAHDMRTSMSSARFWPDSGGQEESVMSTCMVTLRKSHYASLIAARFSAPKAWPMPPPDVVAIRKRAELGLKLTIGLNILVLRASSLSGVRFADDVAPETNLKALPEWLRYMEGLQNQGFFGDEVEGSAAHQRRCQHAETAFRQSQVYANIQKRQATLLRTIHAFTDAPATDAELAGSAKKADDSEAWMADEFGHKIEAFIHQDCCATDADTSTPVRNAGESHACESADLSAHDIMDRLSRFLEAGSSAAGAETDPASFSFDAGKMLQLLQGNSEGRPRVRDADGESDASSVSSDEHVTDESTQGEPALDDLSETHSQQGFMYTYMNQMESELSEKTNGNTRDDHVDVNMESVSNLLKSVTAGSAVMPGAGHGLFGMLGVDVPNDTMSLQ